MSLEISVKANESTSSRLILVSNRLPIQVAEKNGKITMKQSDGGLVTVLKNYFEQESTKDSFNQKIWVGAADFPEKRWLKLKHHADDFKIEPIFIDAKIYNKYYNGFCNATVWPLFHYFPSYVVYDQEFFEKYEQANRLFAERLLSIIQPGDTIWIHDYQLFCCQD